MRILMFGPNGSGKGTQSSRLVKRFQLAHIESGGIFRDHFKNNTELGQKAKAYVDRGELVPDDITIPMVLERLAKPDCAKGWILDGFPRNPSQARALINGLEEAGAALNAVVIIDLARETAKARLLGRRNCPEGHANNTAIDAIKPVERDGRLYCWKCGNPVDARQDDLDETAIDQRLDIYFDAEEGTVASVKVFSDWAQTQDQVNLISINGEGEINAIQTEILSKMGIAD